MCYDPNTIKCKGLPTLRRQSHSADLLAVPSHLLTLKSRAVFVTFLGFQPKGLSETPLYKENFLLKEDDCGRNILVGVFKRIDDALEGGFGPAIVNAMLILIVFCIVEK